MPGSVLCLSHCDVEQGMTTFDTLDTTMRHDPDDSGEQFFVSTHQDLRVSPELDSRSCRPTPQLIVRAAVWDYDSLHQSV